MKILRSIPAFSTAISATALVTLFAALSATPASAQENYATWSSHRNVYLNTTTSGANTASVVQNFPVLVRLGAADAAVFAAARGNGRDIRFTKAGDATRLQHQIELWDSAGKTAAIWVRVDSVKPGNYSQLIRMHYGNAAAADSSKGSAVFSNGFAGVWHLGDASGTNPRPNALAGGNPAVPTNVPGGYGPVNGMIGKADTLRGGWGGTNPNGSNNGNNDRLDLGANTIDYVNGFTFSAWVYPTKLGLNINYYCASSNATDANGTVTGLIILGTSTSVGVKFRQRNSGAANVGIVNTASSELDGVNTWRHMVFTKDAGAGDQYVYMNGELIAQGSGVEAYSSELRNQNWLGASHIGLQYSDSAFGGIMDEARLANVVRSADWARLEYANQKPGQTVVLFDSIPGSLAVRGTKFAHASDFSVKSAGGNVSFRIAGENVASARVSVLDMQGRSVWSGAFAAGSNQLAWNGLGADGRRVPSGVYAVRAAIAGANGEAAKVIDRKLPLTW
jgi:hypothetical protein